MVNAVFRGLWWGNCEPLAERPRFQPGPWTWGRAGEWPSAPARPCNPENAFFRHAQVNEFDWFKRNRGD